MIFINLTQKTIIARNAVKAVTFKERLCGMIGRDFSRFDGMLFERCCAIHTFFMKIPLDILFVSADCHVLKTTQNFPVWRPFLYCKNSFYVIELPSGSIAASGTVTGDTLDIAGVLSPETEKNLSGYHWIQRINGTTVPIKKKD